MTSSWSDAEREVAYTQLCESVTAAGPRGETLFLARLALLLGEALSDQKAFSQALREARVDPAEPAATKTYANTGLDRSDPVDLRRAEDLARGR